MIITQLTMHHFRQFYGTQTIEFAHDGDEMVTVILGENGRGKTGLYRAVMYALFGDRTLEQDAKGKGVLLANSRALKEDEAGQHRGIESSVRIRFRHADKDYELHRSQLSRQQANGKVHEEASELILIDHTDGSRITKKEEVERFIHDLLDERVKHYFFFDGERIERLTRVDEDQKEEVATGIRNLLKIDQVLKSRDVLGHMLKATSKQLEKHSTGDYKKALQKRNSLQEQIEEAKNEQARINKEQTALAVRIQEIDNRLEELSQVSVAIRQRRELEKEKEGVSKGYAEAQQALTALHSTIGLLMARDVLYEVKKQLDFYLGENRLEETMTASGLQELIHDLTCICGRAFDEDSEEYRRLQSLYRSVKSQESNQAYYEMKAEVMQLIGYLEGKESELSERLSDLKSYETRLESLNYQIEQLNQQVTGSSEQSIQELGEEREAVVTRKAQHEVEFRRLEEEWTELENELAKVDLQLKDLKVKSGLHQQLLTKEEKLKESVDVMDRAINGFEQDVIQDLELATSENLAYLLDDSGRQNLQDVKVEQDYSLEVYNAFNQPFLANISQGQRQVLSLSFITALAQVAGGNKALEMPLFMDTPFGRLSTDHQENLMNFIPQIASQWILLVTDREYDETVKRKFESSGVVGRFYRLESTEPGVTTIEAGEVLNHD
ncbi:AAA family ATPase [Halobacillus salinus]|uniref:Nuclease SbcCD subunit C n=1 Tax=Halobacillus salinus TaxID=192814 RepID=A0A4Z0H0X8_9BACI|nr:AAA family ATPase [Halobacillus salinus]TGB03497.1 DNA sulfur modification protein DndD [Halobacillus salinus]